MERVDSGEQTGSDGESSAEEFVFRDPQGRVVDGSTRLNRVGGSHVSFEGLVAMNRTFGLELGPESFVCEWNGDAPQYDYIAECTVPWARMTAPEPG